MNKSTSCFIKQSLLDINERIDGYQWKDKQNLLISSGWNFVSYWPHSKIHRGCVIFKPHRLLWFANVQMICLQSYDYDLQVMHSFSNGSEKEQNFLGYSWNIDVFLKCKNQVTPMSGLYYQSLFWCVWIKIKISSEIVSLGC